MYKNKYGRRIWYKYIILYIFVMSVGTVLGQDEERNGFEGIWYLVSGILYLGTDPCGPVPSEG